MGENQEGNDVRVIQINAGDDDGADITFDYNGKRIAVSLFASSSSPAHGSTQAKRPIEDRLIHLLSQAVAAPDETYDDLVDEALDVILDVGRTRFAKLAPSSQATNHSNRDLHSHLYPETLDFRLQTIDGKAAVFPIRPDEANSLADMGPDPDFDLDFQIDDKLPQYSSKEILVLEVLVGGSGTVSRVQVDGQEMLCKARRAGLLDPNLEQEIVCLQKVWKTYLEAGVSVRVPKLLGYAKHAESEAIIGLLREYIPAGTRGCTLRDVDVSAVPRETRQKWAAQIFETVNRLHDAGVVWGDGKVSNVVVDQADDTWLIDFAGGWSEGWVDERLAGTVEGDNQAVRRIMEFLDL